MALIYGHYFSSLPTACTKDKPVPVLVDAYGRLIVVGPGASSSGESLAGLQYNLVPPTLTNGAVGPVQGDALGSLRVAEQNASGAEDNSNNVLAVLPRPLPGVASYSPNVFANFGANATLNVKATAGNVYGVHCINTNGSIRYLQLHNTATTPAGGAAPLVSFPMMPTTGSVVLDQSFFTQAGMYFSTGIAFAVSTAAATYTAATAGDHQTHVVYK